MRKLALACLFALALQTFLSGRGYAAEGEQFRTEGFRHLAETFPDVVGQPLQEEYGASFGTMQVTTTGVVYWQPSTGALAWTDGWNRKGFWPGTSTIAEWEGSSLEPIPQQQVAEVVYSTVWDRLKACETPGLGWDANTDNGFYGGLQFDYTTWLSGGGAKYARTANLATRAQQIEIAEVIHARRGFQPWPACSRALRLALR